MSKRYTDEDVERLVKAAENCSISWSNGHSIQPNSMNSEGLKFSLAPFRPDPEEELIEAMAHGQCQAWLGRYGLEWGLIDELTRDNYRLSARAALAVVKEKGYFNDQR